ncbi:hypothetical protein, partial [Agrobacterium vitis]|uniref:hypothetical protein n=1 Tax=Agrobacterium vitis TaxID=373 RepID=UPI001F2EDFAC
SDTPRNQVIDFTELYRRIWARQRDYRSQRAELTRQTKARWKCKARHGPPSTTARRSTEPGESGKPGHGKGAIKR